MSATTRTTQAAPELRQLGVAIGALILAVALVVAVAYSQQMTTRSSSAAAPAAAFDRDHAADSTWTKTTQSTPAGGNRGSHGNADRQVDISRGLVVSGTNGGGILYNGIPYQPSANDSTGGSNGTRFAR